MSMKRVRDEKSESAAVVNIILASENVKLAESISWTKPKAAKKQKTDEEAVTTLEPTMASGGAAGGEAAVTAPTLSVLVTDEHAMSVTPLTTASTNPPASPSTPATLSAGDVVLTTRSALEQWVASCPPSSLASGSFAQSTPSRLRRMASPAYIDALHVLGPLLAQQQYGAALTQLNTVATLFPCHRTQAEYYVLRAFTVEKLQQSDGEVCSVYSAAIDSGAQPASGVLEGFQSFERRHNERLGRTSSVASRVGVNVPATPMSRLLHKYRSARPSLAATTAAVVGPASAAGVPPATPRSAMLRSMLTDDDERDDGRAECCSGHTALSTAAKAEAHPRIHLLSTSSSYHYSDPAATATAARRTTERSTSGHTTHGS